MLDFYFAVHSDPTGLTGMAIRTGTELYCQTPWLMGAAHPATHGFLMWGHPDGVVYRLDGQPPVALMTVHAPGWDVAKQSSYAVKTAVWKLTSGGGLPAADRVAMLRRAVALAGADYGQLEIIEQALPLPPGMKMLDPIRHSMICTRLVLEVLAAGPMEGRALAGALPDLYPERFGRALQDAVEHGSQWLQRVL